MASESDPAAEEAVPEPGAPNEAATERWPVGFMLTIVMVSLYVGYRLVQLTVKFFQWLF